MISVLTTTPAVQLDQDAAIAQFEAWASTNPYAPYHLARATGNKHAFVYSNGRAEAAYRGFIAGLAAPGQGSIQAQFEAWVRGKDAPPGLWLSLEPSRYFNFGLYSNATTQYAYEGFIAAYAQRLRAQVPVHAPIPTMDERMDEVAEILDLRSALAAERERTAQLSEALVRYEQLTHPELLYQALHQGFPSRLPERHLRHLANRADDTLLPAA